MRELEDEKLRAAFSRFSRDVHAAGCYAAAIRDTLRKSEGDRYLLKGRMLDYAESGAFGRYGASASYP